jgi:GMP synthase (glutamine-hydrolysing)
MYNKVLVLNYGSQLTQLIARRIRELGVYSEIKDCDFTFEEIKKDNSIKAIILSGGPHSVYEKDAPNIDPRILEMCLPILGICYGQQTISHILGGLVESAPKGEYGRASLDIKKIGFESIFHNIDSPTQIWQSHRDHVTILPTGFEVLATSENCDFAAIGNIESRIYGVQFHPEVVHSIKGAKILSNFLFRIAEIVPNWNPQSYIGDQLVKIREKVGDKKVLCGLSGGVDSSVVAALIHEAIGSQIHCVFVDNGLLRMNEKQEVESIFRNHFKIDLTVVDASEIFLSRLKGVSDPETKRKIIGNTFVEVFDIAKTNLSKEIKINEFMELKIINE